MTGKLWFLLWIALYIELSEEACERSTRILAAEDVCWTSNVKIIDRIQYTTKSVLNFAKEKLGLSSEEPYYPQKCDFYECIFRELKMLNGNGYPNFDKLVEWIDNNVIYTYAKMQYDRLTQCNTALSDSIESDTYFSGDLTPYASEPNQLQDKCEVNQEFMKCLALNGTECIIFTYP